MSDHGMTYGSNPLHEAHPRNFLANTIEVRKINVGQRLGRKYASKVKMLVGSGAYTMVYPKDEARDTDELVRVLKSKLGEDGVDVYRREDIPDELHWRVRETC